MEAIESARANQAKEAELHRANLAAEAEKTRANKAQEALKVAELDYSKYGSGLIPSIIRSIKGLGSDAYDAVNAVAESYQNQDSGQTSQSKVTEISSDTREATTKYGIYYPDITPDRAQTLLDQYDEGKGILSKMSDSDREEAIRRLKQIIQQGGR